MQFHRGGRRYRGPRRIPQSAPIIRSHEQRAHDADCKVVSGRKEPRRARFSCRGELQIWKHTAYEHQTCGEERRGPPSAPIIRGGRKYRGPRRMPQSAPIIRASSMRWKAISTPFAGAKNKGGGAYPGSQALRQVMRHLRVQQKGRAHSLGMQFHRGGRRYRGPRRIPQSAPVIRSHPCGVERAKGT